jgi:hypothetical protein
MGAFTWDYPGSSSGDCVTAIDYCRDVTGDGDCHPFAADHKSIQGGVMNKEFSGYFSAWFKNYVSDVARAPFTDHLSTGAMSTGYAATKAAAMTNPSSSALDLGVSVGEIREIPHLIRERSNRILREAGNSYLTYKFGAVPIARDLINMYRLTSQVDDRVKKIEELKRRGLRNTVTLGLWSATGSQFRWVQTNGAFIGGNFDAETIEQVRAHVRWAPTVELSQLSNPAEIRALAIQATSGATVDFSTIWNLMPWSWLIDWFSSLGDYFAANRNTIPARLQELVVMRHTYTREFWPGGTFADAYGVPILIEPIVGKRESKIRQPWPPDPFNVYLPFLGSGQVAIIGALAASRSH